MQADFVGFELDTVVPKSRWTRTVRFGRDSSNRAPELGPNTSRTIASCETVGALTPCSLPAPTTFISLYPAASPPIVLYRVSASAGDTYPRFEGRRKIFKDSGVLLGNPDVPVIRATRVRVKMMDAGLTGKGPPRQFVPCTVTRHDALHDSATGATLRRRRVLELLLVSRPRSPTPPDSLLHLSTPFPSPIFAVDLSCRLLGVLIVLCRARMDTSTRFRMTMFGILKLNRMLRHECGKENTRQTAACHIYWPRGMTEFINRASPWSHLQDFWKPQIRLMVQRHPVREGQRRLVCSMFGWKFSCSGPFPRAEERQASRGDMRNDCDLRRTIADAVQFSQPHHFFPSPLMSVFGETLGVVTGIIQLVDTALKAREYVKDFYGAPAEQRKLFTEMQDLKPMFEELKRRLDTYASSGSTSVLQHMQEPLARVDKFKATMEKFTAKFKAPGSPLAQLSKQLSWTLWNKKEAKEYLDEFEHIKSLLNFWLMMESWDADQEHKKAHQAILTAIVNNNDEFLD
ncbi:hypothetical protein C8R45DRAFT_932870 [Mycena sanguinolenta]|nr:hypothetical protein C8R45DRAFT_932870 [Mycena sanguinolenta]